MASIALRVPSHSPPLDQNPTPTPAWHPTRAPASLSASILPAHRRPLCRCRASRSGPADESAGGGKRWDELIQGMVAGARKRWEDYVKSYYQTSSLPPQGSEGLGTEVAGGAEGGQETERGEGERGGDWDWERWKRHFAEMEDEEGLVSLLKMQIREAVAREDYSHAAELKRAMSAAEAKDTVGTALSDLSRAVEEERYEDAAFLRDHAGAGLVGWWAGISDDSADPSGRIIHISAEHGKYVAKSYTSRQLTTARPGSPIFEIYFTMVDGEYKQQAVYLKHGSRSSATSLRKLSKRSDVSPSQSASSSEEQNDIYSDVKVNEEEKDGDPDISDGLLGIQNVLRDMIPGVKVKVLKVVAPGKVDKDLIAKVIEQIVEEEDESTEEGLDDIEADDVRAEAEIELEEIETDARDATEEDTEKENDISVKLVIGTLMEKTSTDLPPKDMVRAPAKLEKRDRFSFLFSVEQDNKQQETSARGKALKKRAAALSAQQSYNVMSDLAKAVLSKEKVPMKVLKDVGELISLTMNQNQNHHSLPGSTLFNRIQIPSTLDPLSGLYVGAHGMYTSEILQLKRKFGHWKEEDADMKDLEFYEYVEACKLTGSVSVPAGQVAFRAKVGKQYQLPHKGIIPEEFGVIARYKGQGRIADPGFHNPRWVDGELVILDGKYIRGGPVIGFVYWAPEYHFLIFFNRLRLPE